MPEKRGLRLCNSLIMSVRIQICVDKSWLADKPPVRLSCWLWFVVDKGLLIDSECWGGRYTINTIKKRTGVNPAGLFLPCSWQAINKKFAFAGQVQCGT